MKRRTFFRMSCLAVSCLAVTGLNAQETGGECLNNSPNAGSVNTVKWDGKNFKTVSEAVQQQQTTAVKHAQNTYEAGTYETKDGGKVVYMIYQGTEDPAVDIYENEAAMEEALAAMQKQQNTTPENQAGVKVYPNPSGDKLTVEYGESTGNETIFILCDLEGKEVKRTSLTSTGTQTVDLHGIPSGTYLYKIVTDGTEADTGKIIVQQ